MGHLLDDLEKRKQSASQCRRGLSAKTPVIDLDLGESNAKQDRETNDPSDHNQKSNPLRGQERAVSMPCATRLLPVLIGSG
jgi:hypothetical protein